MSEKKEQLVDYWSVYWAINKHRVGKGREFINKATGEKMSYEFIGSEIVSKNILLQIFSAILWISPVMLIIVVGAVYLNVCIYSLFIAILGIIAYHFAAMYYVIRGPHIVISPVKKKGLFSRK